MYCSSCIGTPKYSGHLNKIIEQARHEADIYAKHKLVSYKNEKFNEIMFTGYIISGCRIN